MDSNERVKSNLSYYHLSVSQVLVDAVKNPKFNKFSNHSKFWIDLFFFKDKYPFHNSLMFVIFSFKFNYLNYIE